MKMCWKVMPSCFFSILGIDTSLKQKCFSVEHTAPSTSGRFYMSTTTELHFLFGRSASSLLFWPQHLIRCDVLSDDFSVAGRDGSNMEPNLSYVILTPVLGHFISVVFISLLNYSLRCHTMLCTLTIFVYRCSSSCRLLFKVFHCHAHLHHLIIIMSLSLIECYWRSSAVLFVLSSQFHRTSSADLSGLLLCCFSIRYVPDLQVWIFIHL
jgi:hypothetical protein